MTEVFCGVTDCIHNDGDRCRKANIRILATAEHPVSTDVVNCMSFTAREEVQDRFPGLASGIDVDPQPPSDRTGPSRTRRATERS